MYILPLAIYLISGNVNKSVSTLKYRLKVLILLLDLSVFWAIKSGNNFINLLKSSTMNENKKVVSQVSIKCKKLESTVLIRDEIANEDEFGQTGMGKIKKAAKYGIVQGEALSLLYNDGSREVRCIKRTACEYCSYC